jgi:hypothetical protein
MTAAPRNSVTDSLALPAARVPAADWVVPALVFVLTVSAGLQRGCFWPAEAAEVALVSAALVVAALIATPPDRRSSLLVASLVVLALWWAIRAVVASSGAGFLPFGGSILAFAAAFAAVRPLVGRVRQLAALAVVLLGCVGALIGFAGLIWRWYPMAMPAQGLWRLSSTPTYADVAGLVLGMCLLVTLGCDRTPTLLRIGVCLMTGGLLATQSRGALVAVACAALLVPWRRYVRFVIPLVAGVGLGIAAVAVSPARGPVPWLGAALAAAVTIAVWDGRGMRRAWSGTRTRLVFGAAILGGLIAAGLLVQHEIGLRVLAPSNQDRSVEWSTAFHQWASAPLLGVGPDRALAFHAVDGTSASFAHNEYLQVGADSGLAGIAFLGLVALSLGRVLRRYDALASCALATAVCLGVAGMFDFDWHLPFVGLLGGWCAGLAVRRETGR